MQLLVATDGSPCSQAAVKEVSSRPWPSGSKVLVLTVSGLPFPTDSGETWDYAKAAATAKEVCDRAAALVRTQNPGLTVEAKVVNDLPKRAIIEEAAKCKADLILIGSHGYGPVQRFLLGSVSHAVALHAPCSVEIVRCPPTE